MKYILHIRPCSIQNEPDFSNFGDILLPIPYINTLVSLNMELDIPLCILFYKFISKTEVYKASKFNN